MLGVGESDNDGEEERDRAPDGDFVTLGSGESELVVVKECDSEGDLEGEADALSVGVNSGVGECDDEIENVAESEVDDDTELSSVEVAD